ncbi:MAG: flagellar protein FlgN [Bacillus sp. (in: firmicutes)]
MMSTTNLIGQLDKLIVLHSSLLDIAADKAEALKKNELAAIEKLLAREQKYVQAIRQTEQQRIEEAARLLGRADGTLLDVILSAPLPDSLKLKQQRERLLGLTAELKGRNRLNQQLIYQSLQFINLSLDMIRPQNRNYNYGKPAQAPAMQQANRGMFDSRA